MIALKERRYTLSSADQVKLVESQISDPDQEVQSSFFLDSIGISDVPPLKLAEILTSRFAKCTTNRQRRRVLDVWKSADLIHSGARKHLIEEVLIPLANLNDGGKNMGATEIALDFLQPLASPIPSGLRTTLQKAIVSATESTRHESRALSILENMGYKVKRSGLWRKRKIDESEIDD